MAEAEAELGSNPRKAAALAVGKAVLTAGEFVFRDTGAVADLCCRHGGNGIDDGSGASGFWIHGFLFF
jgi:hypothetical protein